MNMLIISPAYIYYYDYFDAGAYSTYKKSGDVKLVFRCSRDQHTMIGFTKSNAASSTSFQDITCAMYCDSGRLFTREKGDSKPPSGGSKEYNEWSRLALLRSGSTVSYWMDGEIFHTCSQAVADDMVADVSIHNSGSGGLLEAAWMAPNRELPTSFPRVTGQIAWQCSCLPVAFAFATGRIDILRILTAIISGTAVFGPCCVVHACQKQEQHHSVSTIVCNC